MTGKTKRILITGAAGQIGSELSVALGRKYGEENVVITDIVKPAGLPAGAGPFERLDVTDGPALAALIAKYEVDTIYHLAAILSASGEKKPLKAWEVNVNGLRQVLEVSRETGVKKIFCPSSIAVFGPATPQENAPQDTILDPKTMYGISKVMGELISDYYVARYGLDIRGCRYPGIISHQTLPGGGTTDYAVAIFYAAVKEGRYVCFLKEDTRLPMMYMPDCLKCTMDLMEADFSRLRHHSNFNVAAFSLTPAELAEEIKKHIPSFTVEYKPDFRQDIAESWPASVDDSAARREWDWKPDYDLPKMTGDMIEVLRKRQAGGKLDY